MMEVIGFRFFLKLFGKLASETLVKTIVQNKMKNRLGLYHDPVIIH